MNRITKAAKVEDQQSKNCSWNRCGERDGVLLKHLYQIVDGTGRKNSKNGTNPPFHFVFQT